jgi:hypothetical protein
MGKGLVGDAGSMPSWMSCSAPRLVMVNARLLGRRVSQPLLSMARMMAVPSRPARCGRRSVQSRQPRTLGPEPGLRSVMRKAASSGASR